VATKEAKGFACFWMGDWSLSQEKHKRLSLRNGKGVRSGEKRVREVDQGKRKRVK